MWGARRRRPLAAAEAAVEDGGGDLDDGGGRASGLGALSGVGEVFVGGDDVLEGVDGETNVAVGLLVVADLGELLADVEDALDLGAFGPRRVIDGVHGVSVEVGQDTAVVGGDGEASDHIPNKIYGIRSLSRGSEKKRTNAF